MCSIQDKINGNSWTDRHHTRSRVCHPRIDIKVDDDLAEDMSTLELGLNWTREYVVDGYHVSLLDK